MITGTFWKDVNNVIRFEKSVYRFYKDVDSSSVQSVFLYIGECTEHLDYLPVPAIFTDVEERGETVYFKFRRLMRGGLHKYNKELTKWKNINLITARDAV